jgi:DNA repair protein RadC
MTRRMFDAGKLLGIPVLDHIIITDHDHYSYAEQDRLERFIGDPHPSTEPA